MPYKRGKKWVAQVFYQGQRFQALMDTKKNALKWEQEKRLSLKKLTVSDLSIIDWSNNYLEFSKQNHSKGVFEEKKRAYRHLLSLTGDINLKDITPSILEKHFRNQALQRSGYASNKDLKNLKAAWFWGMKYIKDFPLINPFNEVYKQPEKRKPRYVPPVSDFWKMFESLKRYDDKVMLLTFLYLGARRKEVFKLKWSDIDFNNNTVRLWTGKRESSNKEFDYVPLIDKLKDHLEILKKTQRPKSEFIFIIQDDNINFDKSLYGKPFKTRQHFMRKACDRAGITPFGFHSIRHLSATIMFQAGTPLTVIQSILRHKSPGTTEKYLKGLGLTDIKNFMEKIF